MTSTLYLNAVVFPSPQGASTTPLTVQVFPASIFLNPPTGYAPPPTGVTPAGSATCSPTGEITGLSNEVGYWLVCYNPQGYPHWFSVSWSSGNTSEAPMNLTVPAVEGVQQGLGATMGPLVQYGSIS